MAAKKKTTKPYGNKTKFVMGLPRDLSAKQVVEKAKQQGITVVMIGHVTKEGALAGPRVLEHLVDCVLQFEGERERFYRTLRALKNRFGSTNELGVFEMRDTGLVEVQDAGLPADPAGYR